jgi:hypothetical protein
LTSFATNGLPRANLLNADVENVVFDPVDSKQPPFEGLIINEELCFSYLPEFDRLAAWNKLFHDTQTRLY